MVCQHSRDVQILYPNNSVVLADVGRDFVQRIFTDIGNLSMQSSYLKLGFLVVRRVALFVTVKPLEPSKFLLILLVSLNTVKHFTCRECGKAVYSQIYANHVNILFGDDWLNFNLERDKPSLCRSRNRYGFGIYALWQPFVSFYPTNDWNFNLSLVNSYAAI